MGLERLEDMLNAIAPLREALLGQAHPQHPLAVDRRPAPAFALGVIGLDLGHQCGPGLQTGVQF